jgi:hypothetical protein
VKHKFVLPSFDAYYSPFERGGASTGQALAAVSEEIRRAVREEVRRDLADTGGPIEVEVEYRIANGAAPATGVMREREAEGRGGITAPAAFA